MRDNYMDRRYQVFVSSTYADLREERQKVMQVLMEMDCIPAGMELFPAADEEQMEFIKRVIDDCDYYLLIIGGRYGSLSPEGISYTEQEYDYAMSLGLKVLAFVHENPDELSVGRSDTEPQLRAKLDAFRARVSGSRLVRFWRAQNDLPGLVALSLLKTMKLYPAVGWVRADKVSNDELLSDLNTLRKQNAELSAQVDALREVVDAQPAGNLASLQERFSVVIEYRKYNKGKWYWARRELELPWADVFARIAPDLLEQPSDQVVNSKLADSVAKSLRLNEDSIRVEHDCFQSLKIQLVAQKLVAVSYSKTVGGGMALFWMLTSRGRRLLFELRTIKSSDSSDEVDQSNDDRQECDDDITDVRTR